MRHAKKPEEVDLFFDVICGNSLDVFQREILIKGQ